MDYVDFAVVIGISRYPHLNSLDGPGADAEAFYKWLTDSARMPHNNIRKIVSEDPPKPGDRPIQDDIDAALLDVFAQARTLRNRDGARIRRLYLYFAGHGCAQAFRHLALIMANATPDTLTTSLNTEDYHNAFARLAVFREQLIFYDCCRRYDTRTRGRDSPWSTKDPEPGVVNVAQEVLYATGFTQYASERTVDSSTTRGLFTRALLDGLSGAAAKRDGSNWVITAPSLRQYTDRRLQYLASERNLDQRVYHDSTGPADDLLITRVAEPRLGTVAIVCAPGECTVLVDDNQFHEIQRLRATEGHVVTELPFGRYRMRSEPVSSEQSVEVIPGVPCRVMLTSRT